jgi:hypothetical protein
MKTNQQTFSLFTEEIILAKKQDNSVIEVKSKKGEK